MKVTVYIEKSEFDEFFTWLNRVNFGILCTQPVKFSHRESDIEDPFKIILDSREYTAIKDNQEDLRRIKDNYGECELEFLPETTENSLLLIQDIIREAARYDLANEVIYTALLVMKQLPDVTPSEAIIIAEREWIPK
jgi:hypothetical protein